MADIFISYAKEDREGVAHFASALSDEGYDVWWDTSLLSGDEWRAEVERQLKAAGAVIVCWSKAANESRWVAQEAEEARRLRKLVPVSIAFDEAGGSLEPPFGFRDVQATPLAQWFKAPRHELLLPVFAALERVPGAPSVPARFRRLKQELNAERERRAAIDVRANELGQALTAAEAAASAADAAAAAAATNAALVAADAQRSARANAALAPGLASDPLRVLTAGAAVVAALLAGIAAFQGGTLHAMVDARTTTLNENLAIVQADLVDAARIACGHWASNAYAYDKGGRPSLRGGELRSDGPGANNSGLRPLYLQVQGGNEIEEARAACNALLQESGGPEPAADPAAVPPAH